MELGQPRSVDLKFTFGPFLVARWRLRLRVVDAVATPEQALPPGAAPDMSALASEERGFLFRSQPIEATLPRYAVLPGAVRYVPQQYNRRHVDLTMSYTEYLGRFSSKVRKRLRRQPRNFAALPGGMIFRIYRTPDELREFHAAARKISTQTYQERLYGAGIPDTDRFRAEMADLAATDSVRGYLLFLANEPVSYLCCPIHDGRVCYTFVGFSPAVAQHSPGTVLLWLALAELFQERRFTRFDFLEDDGPTKRLLCTHAVPSANIYFLRRTLGMRALVQSHARIEALGNHVVRLVDRIGLRAALKKKLRRT